MMNIVLEKYHGLGNDYFVFDPNKNELKLTKENVRMICDRNFGMGSDGILEGPIFQEDKIYVKVWNPDGSEAEKSGNGDRIFDKIFEGCRIHSEEVCNLLHTERSDSGNISE